MNKALGWAVGFFVLALIVGSAIQSAGIDRGTTLSEAREDVYGAGFTTAAVVGDSIQNEEEGIVKQSFYVLVGKQNREVDNPDTEPCRATVTWERGTLTLTSATGKIQSNTTNAQALDLPEYAGCA